MKLVEVQEQSSWEAFMAAQSQSSFLQSWQWGVFQEQQGREVKRFFVIDKDVVMACQLIRYNRRFGSCYWFAPRGPVFADAAIPRAHVLTTFFLQELRRQKLLSGWKLFLRLEPALPEMNLSHLPKVLVRTHSMSPASTIRLDVSQDEEMLLSAMHSKTRYNIRVAERHGVTVRESTSEHDLDAFILLTRETAERDEITPHGDDYLRATFRFLQACGMARLRLAEHGSKVLAANMEMAYADTVTYLHGASSSESRKVMAPTLLQWEAMKTAKSQGYKWYDLYGANPSSPESVYYKKSWEGITRFKQGLGGEQINFVGTFDLPLNAFLYKLIFRKGR